MPKGEQVCKDKKFFILTYFSLWRINIMYNINEIAPPPGSWLLMVRPRNDRACLDKRVVRYYAISVSLLAPSVQSRWIYKRTLLM